MEHSSYHQEQGPVSSTPGHLVWTPFPLDSLTSSPWTPASSAEPGTRSDDPTTPHIPFPFAFFFTTIFPKTESTAVPVKSKGPFSKVETTVYGSYALKTAGSKRGKKKKEVSLIRVFNKAWLLFQKFNTKSREPRDVDRIKTIQPITD